MNIHAGCAGRTEDVWQWLTVDTMRVHLDQRGKGLGRALLAAVEEAARARGCLWAKLNTWDFQAPEFYRKQGYDVVCVIPDYPPGITEYTLVKRLR